MRHTPALLLFLLVACTEQDPQAFTPKPTGGTSSSSSSSGTTTTTSLPTTSTSTTPTDTGPEGCEDPLLAPPLPLSTIDIRTEEDFDFDADGYIVYQSGSIVAENTSGDYVVIAPALGGDPAGIQINSQNEVVAVSDNDSTVHVIHRGGGSDIIMSGFSQPNGIEIGENDRVYVTDFAGDTVRWTDPETGDSGIVTNEVSNPDNLVLSPDEQQLFVATADGIAVLDRIPGTDEWDFTPSSYLAQSLAPLFVVEIDECGNLYTASGMDIYRLDVRNQLLEKLATMPTGWTISSIRFGNGVAEFERNLLYVTTRDDIHYMDIGLQGRRHPTTP